MFVQTPPFFIRSTFMSFLTFVLIFTASRLAVADKIVFYQPDGNNRSEFESNAIPPEFLIAGEVFDPITPAAASKSATDASPKITFKLHFEDTDKKGFNADIERIRCADHAADYLASVIKPPQDVTIDIQFKPSGTVASGPPAVGGSFWDFPDVDPNGFKQGHCQKHILTGQDPNENLADIICQVNFGYNWFVLDKDSSAVIKNNEYDLFSFLLHEYCHALGFMALTDVNGLSRVNGTNPGIFSPFSDHLYANGTKLWGPGGEYKGRLEDLVGGKVTFNGPNALAANNNVAIPLFSPDPFELGKSVDHITRSYKYPKAVMQSETKLQEITRVFLPVEKGFLRDLGYTVP